jgi:hypothetical protein
MQDAESVHPGVQGQVDTMLQTGKTHIQKWVVSKHTQLTRSSDSNLPVFPVGLNEGNGPHEEASYH